MVDVNFLLLAILAASCDCLRHSRVIFVLTFGEQRRNKDNVVGVCEIPGGGQGELCMNKGKTYAPAADSLPRLRINTLFLVFKFLLALNSSKTFAEADRLLRLGER